MIWCVMWVGAGETDERQPAAGGEGEGSPECEYPPYRVPLAPPSYRPRRRWRPSRRRWSSWRTSSAPPRPSWRTPTRGWRSERRPSRTWVAPLRQCAWLASPCVCLLGFISACFKSLRSRFFSRISYRMGTISVGVLKLSVYVFSYFLKGQCHENFVINETLGVKSRPYWCTLYSVLF